VTDLVCCDGEFFDGGHGILQVLFLRLLPLEFPFQTLHFGRETCKSAAAREAAMAESGWMSVCLSECAAPFEECTLCIQTISTGATRHERQHDTHTHTQAPIAHAFHKGASLAIAKRKRTSCRCIWVCPRMRASLFARCVLQHKVHRNEQEANTALQQPRGTEKRAMRSPVDSILVFLQDGNVFLVLFVHLQRDKCAVSNDNGEQDQTTRQTQHHLPTTTTCTRTLHSSSPSLHPSTVR
jgi:hypothetical protein